MSTWGDAWGAAWGDSWGAIDVAVPPGAGGGRYVALQRPVEPERANEILLLLAAQIAIGTVH